MGNCKINVKIQGLEREFNSEQELDAFLYDNQNSLISHYDAKTGSVTYSLNPGEATRRKLTEKINVWTNVGGTSPTSSSTISNDETSLGVTLLMNFSGNKIHWEKPLNTYDSEKDKENFLSRKIVEYKNAGETDDIASQLAKRDWDNNQKIATRINQIGSGGHAILSDVFSDKITNSNNKNYKCFTRNDGGINKIKEQVVNPLRKMIAAHFGENVFFAGSVFMESHIYSTEINEEYKKVLHGLNTAIEKEIERLEARNLNSDKKTIESLKSILAGNDFSLHGIVDMMIVDDSGAINLYDFKFAKKNYDDWYESKKDASELQLQIYANILRQAGFKIGQIGIIPIEVTIDENNVDKLESVEYKLSGLNFNSTIKHCNDPNVKQTADRIVPNNERIDLSELNRHNQLIGQLFPGKDLDKVSKKAEYDYEYFKENYCKKLSEDDPEYKKGEREFYFYDNVKKLESGERADRIIFSEKNEERVIKEYLIRFNEARAKTNIILGQKLKEYSKDSYFDKKTLLTDLFRNFCYYKEDVDSNVNLFLPLLTNGWKLVGSENDEAAWANGYFMFEKNNIIQFVVLDGSKNLGRKVDINGQTTIFGNTTLDSETDSTKHLPATYANLLAMKAMCYISDTPFFQEKRILGVTIKNVEESSIFQISNDLLISNWNELVNKNKDKIEGLKTIGERKMFSDVDSALYLANEWMDTISGGSEVAGKIRTIRSQKENIRLTIVNIEFICNELKQKYFRTTSLTKVSADQINSPAYKAIVALSKALLSLNEIYMMNELDVGQVWEPETKSLGTNFSPFFMSESANLRNLDKISTMYFDSIASEFRKGALPWQKLMKEAIQEWQEHPELHYSSALGGEYTVFDQWFRRDAWDESKRDSQLILKSPNDPYFNNLPKSKKLLTFFLDKLNLMRYGNERESELARLDNPEEWYSIPLMRSSTLEQFSKTGLNPKKLLKSVEAWFKRKTQTHLEGYDDAEIEKDLLNQLNELDSDSLGNSYLNLTMQKRQELLDKQSQVYETNLDLIFLRVLAEDAKSKVSETFLPMFTAFRTLLYYNSVVNGQPADNLMKSTEEFIRSRIFRQNIIDSKLQGIAMWTGLLRSIVSKVTLGLNTRNFVRENLISFIDTAKETFLKSGFDVFPVFTSGIGDRTRWFSEYKTSFAKIAASTVEMNDVMSEIQQFNAMYRMVDFDQRKMAHTSQTNRFKPFNLTEDVLYMTTNLPDYYHRNAILIASLKYLGAYEAHKIDEETGELIYDMEKDDRYKILFKYEFDSGKVPYKEMDKFLKARREYEVVLNEWNNSGKNYKFGDKFEFALSPREAANVRNFGHYMFGCYDPSQRAMINSYFLGSIYFQFKTYSLNQITKGFRSGGAINIVHPTYVTDEETGEQLYDVVTTTQEDFEKYGETKRVKFSEVSQEDLKSGRAKPVITFSGSYMEGMYRSVLQIPGMVMRWDQKEFEKWWGQPHVRANILGSLWDNLFMLMLLLLTQQLYGTDVVTDMDEQSWFTQWSYGILTGVSKNGLIWEVTNSIYGDGTPPMVSSLKRYYTTMNKVIFGDTSLLYAATNTIGATRELSYFFKEDK